MRKRIAEMIVAVVFRDGNTAAFPGRCV